MQTLVSTQLTQLNIHIHLRHSQQPSLAAQLFAPSACVSRTWSVNLDPAHRLDGSRRLLYPPGHKVTHSPVIVKHVGAVTSLCWSRSPALKHFNYRARVAIQHTHQCLAPICLFLPPDRTGTRASKASQPTWRAFLRNTPRWPYT